jgi:4-aminobutyrate aminotransferase-like enzyme
VKLIAAEDSLEWRLTVSYRLPESFVFHRSLGRALPAIERGEGALLWDREGRRYLDGSSGAVVVNVGHGRREIAEAMARQASAVAYVHGTQFTSEVLEEYARRLARPFVASDAELDEMASTLDRVLHDSGL